MTIIIIHVLHIIIILHAEPMWYTIPGNTILLPGSNILLLILLLLLFRFGALRAGWKENGYKKK